MKVLHASISHGVLDDRIFHREALSLAAAGHDVTVWGIGDEALDDRVHGVRCRQIIVPRGGVPARLKALKGFLKSADTDILHIHEVHSLAMARGFASRRAWKLIYDVHEDFPELIRTFSRRHPLRREITARLISLYERIYAPKCDALITVTPFLSQKFAACCPLIVELRNYPVSRPEYSEKTSESEDKQKLPWPGDCELRIIYAGQISRKRELELALETVELLQSRHGIAAHFMAIGPGDEEDLVYYDRRFRSTLHAELLPPLRHEDVDRVLQSADLGWNILPLHRNFLHALPNKSFEYLKAGLPFIASGMPLLKEVLSKHSVGLLAPQLSPAVIAEQIAKAYRDGYFSEELKQRAVSAYLEDYRWDSEAKKLLDLYRRLEGSSV